MREPTSHSPADRGEVAMSGRCQGCGAEGRVLAVPGAPPPNELCPRCAIEYADHVGGAEDELAAE
jgi:hypothetical protein